MTAIRVEHPKPPAEVPASTATIPPEWKWDTLPVLKEVIETDTPSSDAPPTVETTE